MDSKLR
jgi:hypothetical protein